jgi:hypothetical protein
VRAVKINPVLIRFPPPPLFNLTIGVLTGPVSSVERRGETGLLLARLMGHGVTRDAIVRPDSNASGDTSAYDLWIRAGDPYFE